MNSFVSGKTIRRGPSEVETYTGRSMDLPIIRRILGRERPLEEHAAIHCMLVAFRVKCRESFVPDVNDKKLDSGRGEQTEDLIDNQRWTGDDTSVINIFYRPEENTTPSARKSREARRKGTESKIETLSRTASVL